MAELQAEYDKFMGECAVQIGSFENEICALKKIRTELNKVEGDSNAAFFDDCEVGDWTPEQCTVTCGGGMKHLSRAILVHPHGGAPCPPLEMDEPCNENPCPIDCVMSDWSEWAACTASCGGGVKQKNRQVITEAEHEGEPCGELSSAESCGVGSCDKDCVLADWTAWSACSKACDGGFSTR